MIHLSGGCKLAGEWPVSGPSIVGEVMSRDADQLIIDCFFGCERQTVTATFQLSDDASPTPQLALSSELSHLGVGDFISIYPKSGRLRVLFRKESQTNNFLVTEVCDNYCLMCSQPPRKVNDERLLDEIAAIVPRLPKDLHEIGFTGGEPTLRGERFFSILRLLRDELPATAVHVLSNGRAFSRPELAQAWADIRHPDLMVGIPIYSDQSDIHDYVVQADGAFDETVRGVLNLKALRQAVEVRIVLHRHTIGRLEKFAYFIARNLSAVDHVALMGLELMGFAVAHQDDLWIDPREHKRAITRAAQTLAWAGLRVSIYNLPLCVLSADARRYAIRSISDWKREYWQACSECSLREKCGGAFFSSRNRMEPYIAPIRELVESADSVIVQEPARRA